MIDIKKIMDLIPHRYPFLLVDKVIAMNIDGDTSSERRLQNHNLIAIKNVSVNEHFFVGHFPEKPVMPGVLIIEALAQAAVILLSASNKMEGKICFLSAIENARFRNPVVPGDVLLLKVKNLGGRHGLWKMRGSAVIRRFVPSQVRDFYNGDLNISHEEIIGAEADISAVLVNKG